MIRLRFHLLRAYIFLSLAKLLAIILMVEKTPLASVAGIIEKDGKILLLKQTYVKGLGIPGGIIEATETLETALWREIREETGLSVTDSAYFYSTTAFFKGYPTLSIIFKAKAEGEMKGSDEGELVWINPEDALGKMAYEASEKALRAYINDKKMPQ